MLHHLPVVTGMLYLRSIPYPEIETRREGMVTDGQLEVQVRKQPENFRLLVESVKDYAIFLLDPTGCIMSWNEGARRIKGYTPQEIIGKHFSIFYPPRDIQHGKPDYALRVAADEGRWEEEGWRVRKDGSRFWASVVITALFEHGELVGFAKVTRDLTERKRAEEERTQLLQREQAARAKTEIMVERLQAIGSVTEAALAHLNLDDLLDALLDRIVEILSVDTVGVLLLEHADGDVLVARAAKGIEEEVEHGVRIPVGKGFAGWIAAQRQPLVLDDVEHTDVLNPILNHNGIRSLMGVPLIIEGRVLGVLHVGSLHRRQFNHQDVQLLQIVADRVALAIDHTRLVEAARVARLQAEVAEATVQARDEFLSVAAHELKTPLTSLRLTAQTLLRRLDRGVTLDAGSLDRSLRTFDRQLDRMSRLVTELIESVRLHAGRFELERKHTDLGQLVREVADMAQIRTNLHQLLVCAADNASVAVDPLRFEQVVVNLLDNAIKYSPEGGQIEIEVGRPSPAIVRLSVRDHGLGVPAEHRSRLFQQYHQAHERDHRSGMGLGLYISRQIVEMHGGHIWAEFPPDGGSRFVVDLPSQIDAGKEGAA